MIKTLYNFSGTNIIAPKCVSKDILRGVKDGAACTMSFFTGNDLPVISKTYRQWGLSYRKSKYAPPLWARMFPSLWHDDKMHQIIDPDNIVISISRFKPPKGKHTLGHVARLQGSPSITIYPRQIGRQKGQKSSDTFEYLNQQEVLYYISYWVTVHEILHLHPLFLGHCISGQCTMNASLFSYSPTNLDTKNPLGLCDDCAEKLSLFNKSPKARKEMIKDAYKGAVREQKWELQRLRIRWNFRIPDEDNTGLEQEINNVKSAIRNHVQYLQAYNTQ
ncbi:MAG: hypothetical protein FWC83_00230 [Alphaproteobacteria bacterium]|nr:hypothetical protein [Alphaproteobacteria bacterium]